MEEGGRRRVHTGERDGEEEGRGGGEEEVGI